MYTNFGIGSLMIILTALIHTALTGYVVHYLRRRVKPSAGQPVLRSVLRIDFVILLVMAATLFETSLWALAYLYSGALIQFEEALYFSIITFTTLGYGDIILDDQWRLLAAIEAANGIIVFGWSTSLVILTIQKISSKNG